MIFRREKPKLRESILKICDLYGFTLNELLIQRDIHFNPAYRSQIRKMIEEEKAEAFLSGLDHTEDGFPIIDCILEKNQWVFMCPFCKRKHYHSPFPGHRCAHCHSEHSPFARGYVLRLKP